MDKAVYPFATLKTKYSGFHAPECSITIGSLTLKDSEVSIPEVEVELSSEGIAGGCSITIMDKYDYKSGKWDSKLMDALKVGEKLSIKMGYIKTKEVFYGFVDDFSISYESDTGPKIYITGMGAVGYLMSVRSRLYAGKKKVASVVKELLGNAVSAGAAKKLTVGATLTDMEIERIMEGEDSYSFLKTLARQLGASFFCVDGELIFDKVYSFSLSLTSLTFGEGLDSFTKRLSVANQPGKVVVHGRDVNNEAISGEVSSTSLSGSGKAAASVASSLLSKSVYEIENSMVKTEAECKTLAQNIFDDMAKNYVFGSGECVGIPELIPGRFIDIDGCDKNTNGSYFLKKVTHILNSSGYVTRFEVGGAKSK